MKTLIAILLLLLAVAFANSYTFGSLIVLVGIVSGRRLVLDLLKGSEPRDLT